MKGKYEVVVKSRRVQYKFSVIRNITILRGDSATGKTTLIAVSYTHLDVYKRQDGKYTSKRAAKAIAANCAVLPLILCGSLMRNVQ